MQREKCPGTNDWALDNRWHPEQRHTYRCYGCQRWLRIPQRGRRVGLVPFHKRTKEEKAKKKNMNTADFTDTLDLAAREMRAAQHRHDEHVEKCEDCQAVRCDDLCDTGEELRAVAYKAALAIDKALDDWLAERERP
jgi:hypothetical protein